MGSNYIRTPDSVAAIQESKRVPHRALIRQHIHLSDHHSPHPERCTDQIPQRLIHSPRARLCTWLVHRGTPKAQRTVTSRLYDSEPWPTIHPPYQAALAWTDISSSCALLVPPARRRLIVPWRVTLLFLSSCHHHRPQRQTLWLPLPQMTVLHMSAWLRLLTRIRFPILHR